MELLQVLFSLITGLISFIILSFDAIKYYGFKNISAILAYGFKKGVVNSHHFIKAIMNGSTPSTNVSMFTILFFILILSLLLFLTGFIDFGKKMFIIVTVLVIIALIGVLVSSFFGAGIDLSFVKDTVQEVVQNITTNGSIQNNLISLI